MRLSGDALRGRTVISADGNVIGDLATLQVDCDSWKVESLYVRLRKDVADRLGAERSVFRPGVLEIPIGMVQSVADTLILSVPTDELRQVIPAASEPAHH